MSILKTLLALSLIVSVYQVRAEDDWADDSAASETMDEPMDTTGLEEPAEPMDESFDGEEPAAAPVVKTEPKAAPKATATKATKGKAMKATKGKAKGRKIAKSKKGKKLKPAKSKGSKDSSNTTM